MMYAQIIAINRHHPNRELVKEAKIFYGKEIFEPLGRVWEQQFVCVCTYYEWINGEKVYHGVNFTEQLENYKQWEKLNENKYRNDFTDEYMRYAHDQEKYENPFKRKEWYKYAGQTSQQESEDQTKQSLSDLIEELKKRGFF